MLRKIMLSVLCALVLHSASAQAASSAIVANVTKILVDDANFGGCMVKFSVDPSVNLAGCAANFLTFDCNADFPESTKANAQTKLGQAQLALVSGRGVYVKYTDDRKANGYCFARRIDVD